MVLGGTRGCKISLAVIHQIERVAPHVAGDLRYDSCTFNCVVVAMLPLRFG